MTNQQPLYVLCAANAAYGIPLAVMLTSMVCNLKTNREVHIYIMESDIQDPLRKKIEASVLGNKRESPITFHWVEVDGSLIDDLHVSGHIRSETYSRLLAPYVLPPACDRVVYLDSDLVVLNDISVLNDSADSRCTVAAVPDLLYPYVSWESVVFNHVELGIPASNRYFNAGVMVINLASWREQKVTSRVIEYLQAHKDKVHYHDQGGLNAILHDQWLQLDLRWNQTHAILYSERWRPAGYSRKVWAESKNDPFIVHYTGGAKPWQPGHNGLRSSFFKHYLKKTAFKDEIKVFSLEDVIGYRTHFLVWRNLRRVKRMLQSALGKREMLPAS
jgi:lipopolysaccharide biosynthesis glycosyltransferase